LGMRWLCGVLLLLGQFGCLGFFEEPQTVQAQENNPPWIDLASITPQTSFVEIDKTNDPTGVTTFFVGRALDFDRGDLLWGYWILVNKTGTERYISCGKQQAPPPQDFDPFKAREVNFTCNVRHDLAQLEVGTSHTFEMFVVDQNVPLEDLRLPGLTGLPRDKNRFTSVKWFLQVE